MQPTVSSGYGPDTNANNCSVQRPALYKLMQIKCLSSQCVQQPQASPTPKCHRYYNHTSGICNSSVPVDAWIFVDRNQQIEHEKRMRTVRIKRDYFGSIRMPNPAVLQKNKCFRIIQDMYCHRYFPRCDVTSNITQPQAICRFVGVEKLGVTSLNILHANVFNGGSLSRPPILKRFT